jgi:hypothetical protein
MGLIVMNVCAVWTDVHSHMHTFGGVFSAGTGGVLQPAVHIGDVTKAENPDLLFPG